MQFKRIKRAGRVYVRGFVTVGEWHDGLQIAVMGPTRSALRKAFGRIAPTIVFDPKKVKKYKVVRDQ